MAYLGLLEKEDDRVIDGPREGSLPLHRLLSENRVYPELWLIENNPETTRLFPNQEDFSKRHSAEKDYSKMKQKAVNQNSGLGDKANYNKFLENFPGLSSLLPPKIRNEKVKEDENTTLERDTSCTTFTVMMLIIVLTTVVIVTRIDSNETYWNQYAVTSKLTTMFDNFGYNNMASLEDIEAFYNLIIPALLFPQHPFQDGILQAFHLMGPVRLRQVRTQTTNCATHFVALESNSYNCYETQYSDTTRETADLEGEMPWMKFQTASETGISSTFTGFLSTYDGSGYVMDFYGNTTSADFLDYHTNMLKFNWLGPSTRAVFLTFTLYDPITDHWLFINNGIELGTCGAVIPTPLTPEVFRPNMYETGVDKSVSAADAIRFVLSFYFWVITANEVASRGSGRWRFKWSYFMSTNFIRDFVTFFLILIGFALANTLKFDTSSALRNNNFHDFASTAQVFRVSIQLNIISVMFVFMRLLLVLQRFQSAQVVLQSMSKTLGRIVAYLMLLTPMIMGLAVASVNIWGSYLIKFHTVHYAFIANVLLSVGMVDALQMYMVNSVWTVIFILVSLLVWMFYIIAVFKGVYLDSRMASRQKLGYGEKRVGSGFGKLAWWLINFLPKRLVRKLRDWSDERKARKAEEENIAAKKQKAEKDQESNAPLDSLKDVETGRKRSDGQAEQST